jgi:filamentous hemagglutinin
MPRSFAPPLPTPEQRRAWSNLTFQTHVPASRGAPAYKGPVDLRPTIQRIGQPGPRLGSHDGGVFRNNFRNGGSGLRPQRPGYYREFVVPTPGVQGPGQQRLVVGQRGEMYYTPNHYQSFRQVR